MTNQSSQTVLSGLRPTGRVHLGNYFGAVRNWVRLQEKYRCYYFVADWHALTSDYADPSKIKQATFDAVADWMAAGMDPKKCTIFLQSEVKEHAELHLLLSMITPLPWLERVPSFKDQQQELKDRDLNTYGFLGYPLLQTADVIIYRANFVPVGEDQASHLELSREIVRRFNNFYGDVFPEPLPLFTETPKVPGLDGRKMSKSYGNTIPLTASADEIRALVMTMFTDPNRIRRQDPGNPDICNLFQFHKLFSDDATIARVDRQCRAAQTAPATSRPSSRCSPTRLRSPCSTAPPPPPARPGNETPTPASSSDGEPTARASPAAPRPAPPLHAAA